MMPALKPPNHQADHGDRDKGFRSGRQDFVVFAQAAGVAEPGEGTLHEPAPRQDFEFVRMGYRWDATMRCWNLETSEAMLEEELRRLKRLAYPKRSVKISVEMLDARVRFSDRPGVTEERVI